MNENRIFQTFLKNQELREAVDIQEKHLDKMDISTYNENILIDVIKTAILFTKNENDIDGASRKINRLFK